MAKHEDIKKEIEAKETLIQAYTDGLSKLNTRLTEARTELHELEGRRGEVCGLVAMGRADPGEVLTIRERIRDLEAEFRESSEGRDWLIERRKLLTEEMNKAKLVDVPFLKGLLKQYEEAKAEYPKAYKTHIQCETSKSVSDTATRRRKEAGANVTTRRERLHSLARWVGKEDDLVAFLQDVEAEA